MQGDQSVRVRDLDDDGAVTFKAQYSSFSKAIVDSMRDVSELADKRASTFLLTLGTVLLILAMFWRLRPFGLQVSDLVASEFIALLLLSGLFVLGGTLLRLYQERVMNAVTKEMREEGAKLFERTYATAAALLEKGGRRDPGGV